MALALSKNLACQESLKAEYIALQQKFDEERAKGNTDVNGWPPIVEGWFAKGSVALEGQACAFEDLIERGKDYRIGEVYERSCLIKEVKWIRLFIKHFDLLCNPRTHLMEGTHLMEVFKKSYNVMMELLLQHSSIDPTFNDSQILRNASVLGYQTSVAVLLKDGRADPSARESEALSNATDRGYIEIVRLLLKDGRADPSARESEALSNATDRGYIEIVRLLLKDGRADYFSVGRHLILKKPEILSLYLKDPRCTNEHVQLLFEYAVEHRDFYRVKNLLEDVRIDLSSKDRIIMGLLEDLDYEYQFKLFHVLEVLLYNSKLQHLSLETYNRALQVLSKIIKRSPLLREIRALIRHLCENTSIPWTTRMYYKMF
jgi:hypothetical protein